jgi:acyl carrier protein
LFNKIDEVLVEDDAVEKPAVLVDEEITETELLVARIYHSVLACKGISKNDNYYELGGNSLSAIRLVNMVNAEFDVNLNMSVIATHPSVARLAAYLESLSTTSYQIMDEGEV